MFWAAAARMAAALLPFRLSVIGMTVTESSSKHQPSTHGQRVDRLRRTCTAQHRTTLTRQHRAQPTEHLQTHRLSHQEYPTGCHCCSRRAPDAPVGFRHLGLRPALVDDRLDSVVQQRSRLADDLGPKHQHTHQYDLCVRASGRTRARRERAHTAHVKRPRSRHASMLRGGLHIVTQLTLRSGPP